MLRNRSIPDCIVMPELAYPDVAFAIVWLCAAFDFTLRLRIAEHRAQLQVPGGGAVVLIQGRQEESTDEYAHCVLVRVEDAKSHHVRAKQHGAKIVRDVADHPYGERQYTAADHVRHIWTFSQSIADIDPTDWGGIVDSRADRRCRNTD